jgi:hypothetical protein
MLCRFPTKNRLNPQSLPREELRRELETLGVARERHRLGELIEMLPTRLDGQPYQDFDADCVAEVLVYLVSKGVIHVPAAEAAPLRLDWGERLCHFYRHEEELLVLLGHYFRQGLERNERCVWLAADAASEKARQTIAALADSHGTPEQLEVIDDAIWIWQREEERAVAQGYSGLRICGEALSLQRGVRMKALSTYRRDGLQRDEIASLIRAHDGALVKTGAGWQRVQFLRDDDGHDAQLA